jgi:FtsH-binding integral membrane protein
VSVNSLIDHGSLPPVGRGAATTETDLGLRQYMLKVYNFMGAGLGLTGLVAYVAVATGFYQQIAHTPLIWVVMLAPLSVVLLLSFRIERMSGGAVQIAFWGYSALMGLSLAGVFFLYTDVSIARVFFISGATFAAMSLYGYTSRRDLSHFGSFLFMGLIGIVLPSLVNIFIGSTALQFAISVIGVLVFTGLTARDTQRIEEVYLASDPGDGLAKKALIGALSRSTSTSSTCSFYCCSSQVNGGSRGAAIVSPHRRRRRREHEDFRGSAEGVRSGVPARSGADVSDRRSP